MGQVNLRTLAFFFPYLLYSAIKISIRIMLFFTTGHELLVLQFSYRALIYRTKLHIQLLLTSILKQNHDTIMSIVRILCWPWVAINGIIPPNCKKKGTIIPAHQSHIPRLNLYPRNLLIFSHVQVHMSMLYLWGMVNTGFRHLTMEDISDGLDKIVQWATFITDVLTALPPP